MMTMSKQHEERNPGQKNNYEGIVYQPISDRFVAIVGKTRIGDYYSLPEALTARNYHIADTAANRIAEQEARNDAHNG
jgi:hypothetical protein